MTLQNLLPFLFVFFAGAIVPPAVALNAILGRMLNSPMLAAMVVMFAGGILVASLAFIRREAPPSADELAVIPWFVWLGGVLICVYMLLMNYNVPKVGVGLATSIVVAAQLITGLAMDHYGLLGLPQTSFSIGRFFGFLAILAGVALVKFY